MTERSDLRRQILEYIKGESDPEGLPVRFGPTTSIGTHEPERVLQEVRQLREEGYLEVMEVEMNRDGQPVEITIRGLTSKGEDAAQQRARQ